MTSDWKEYTVQELIDNDFLEEPFDGNHGNIHPKSTDYVPSGIPFIMANDLKNGTVDYKNCVFITEQQANTLKKGIAKPGDVLLTHKATIGRTAIVPDTYDKIILTPQVTYYRVKNNINNVYLKYYFDSPFFQNTFINWACSGSTRYYLGILAQHKLPIILPPLETQQKIARVLGAIDDKIELNNSINKNLEQQAQHYFDEIVSKAAELSYIAIGDICDVKGGKRLPKGINLVTTPNSHPYIRVRDLNDICVAQLNSNYEYVDDETQKTISRYTVSSKNVIISIVGTIGLTAIVGKTLDNANLTENCVKLTNIKTVTSEYILLFLRSKEGQEAIKLNTVGAVQAKLPIKNIQAIKVPIFSDKEFNEYINSIFKNIANNILENNKLIQLRDTLLPKLMSGEIDVDKVEE